MLLAFYLDMPQCGSWNGKWSGRQKKYVLVKDFKTHDQIENAKNILKVGYYNYSWSDGWCAGVTVEEVDAKTAKKIRRESDGFCGYNWMVDTICNYGKIMSNYEVEELLQGQS
jgi:hypothetical protein